MPSEGYVSCAAVAALLSMSTNGLNPEQLSALLSDNSIDSLVMFRDQMGSIYKDNCSLQAPYFYGRNIDKYSNETFKEIVEKDEYFGMSSQDNVIPILDILYFTKKLDSLITKLVKSKSHDISIVSRVSAQTPKSQQKLCEYFDMNGDGVVSAISKTSESSQWMRDIVTAITSMEGIDPATGEFASDRNGPYLRLNKEKLTYRDRIEHPKFTRDVRYYLTAGIVRKFIADEQDWAAAIIQAQTSLYYDMIEKRNLQSVVSKDEFLACIFGATALQDYYMPASFRGNFREVGGND